MSEMPPDRYERAPAEGEFYDPKGYRLLKHFRTWAKIATVLMALVLLVTVVGATTDEDPLPKGTYLSRYGLLPAENAVNTSV